MISKRLEKILCLSCLSLALIGSGGASANNASAKSRHPRMSRRIHYNSRLIRRLERKVNKLQREYRHLSARQRHHKIHRTVVRRGRHGHKIRKRVTITRGAYLKKQINRLNGVLKRYSSDVYHLDSLHLSRSAFKRDYTAYLGMQSQVSRSPKLIKRYNLNHARWRQHRNHIKHQENEYRNETFKAINYDRESRGLAPVHYDADMNKLANVRAQQLKRRYSHYTKHGQLYMDVDAKRMHINWAPGLGENIDQKLAPGINNEPMGQLYMPDTGHQMGDESEDLMMYHDQFRDRRDGNYNGSAMENNSHRTNILRSSDNAIGIGVSYDPKTRTFSLAEIFHIGNKNRHYHGKIHYHDYLKDKYFRNE